MVGDKVVTWVGGGHRDVLRPSVQAGQYRQYLEDNHEAFYADDPPIGLSACKIGSRGSSLFKYFNSYLGARDGVPRSKFGPDTPGEGDEVREGREIVTHPTTTVPAHPPATWLRAERS